MKQFISLSIILFFSNFLFAQNMNNPYAKEWQKADSLLNTGFPESAAKIATSIYEKAQQKGESIQVIKAELFLLNTDFQRSEEAYKNAIEQAEKYIATNKFPIKNIWQSIAAQLYWSYYQQHRWEILQRTQVNTETVIPDFEQWDALRFFHKISGLYEASVAPVAALGKIAIDAYDPLLIKGENTRRLRPSLLDLLAFRALEYFENSEKDLTKPAFAFTLNDAHAFASADAFASYVFRAKDTSSLQFKALLLYQKLLALHQNNNQTDALLDADLLRLAFVYQHSILPDKKELYQKALEKIENDYSSNPLSGLASIEIVNLLLQKNPAAVTYRNTQPVYRESAKDYRPAKEKLETIVAKFPKEEAGLNAQHLLQSILQKTLKATVEEVVLPEEPSRFLLQYRNVSSVNIKIVNIQDRARYWEKRAYNYGKEISINELNKLPVVKQWSVALPATEDYDSHSTEIKIDALPKGMYAVIVSKNDRFTDHDNLMTYAFFQVSNLSLISNDAISNGYVLHRKTGAALSDVVIDFYTQKYNSKQREYFLVKQGSDITTTAGSFSLKNKNDVTILKLSNGDDELYTYGGYYVYGDDREHQQKITQTFFFTDRSIYRPGQTIYFKGILIERSTDRRSNEVIANQKTTVTFYDANGQKISSQNLVTNSMGSFAGSFVAPQGLLNGNMRIENENGSAYFSVEEYKRPKFYVEFDTIKKDFALQEAVTISGNTKAFAGNFIDGAKVSYQVIRNFYFPYPWLCFYYRATPQTASMEIANGETETDAQGNFNISFNAVPDESINPKTLPVFTYNISATVTDINGETHTQTKNIQIGYTSLNIVANIPEKITTEKTNQLSLLTQNLNGDFVPSTLKIKIAKLQAPSTVLRKRLWAIPDQFVMDSLAFKKDFPNDVYRNEDEKEQWSIEKTVWEKTITTSQDGVVVLDKNPLKENGWYVIELSTKDKNGKTIVEKKYTQVIIDATSNEALILINNNKTAESGKKVAVKLLSGYPSLHVLRVVKDAEGVKETTPLHYDGKTLEWTKTLTENDRGGLLVTYVTVKENSVYYASEVIEIPWSNKDLHISWETHRDKLLPGEKETWTMTISGNKKEKLTAELVATLYDASLDALRIHHWRQPDLFPTLNTAFYWNVTKGFGTQYGSVFNTIHNKEIPYYRKSYDALDKVSFLYNNNIGRRYNRALNYSMADAAAPVAMESMAGARTVEKKTAKEEEIITSPNINSSPENTTETPIVPVRKNLQETAFFFPQLQTDEQGTIRLKFTMPEALTEWKMMAFAHTKELSTGLIEGKIKTQKELMVQPNLPRFFRQGDAVFISAKISNLSKNILNGTAKIELKNALTLQVLDLPFRIKSTEKSFSVASEQSTNVQWEIHVPESLYVPVIVTITAQTGNFTDGEENTLPVVTNRKLVTETLPLWMNGSGTKQFQLEKLLHADTSKTLSQHALTIEYTGNPAWYALQALPYMMEYPYECAEQTFNRYYATAIAAHIIAQHPKVKAVFDAWSETTKNGNSSSPLQSPLEKNESLKTALLEETPWVVEAQNETEQRKRIAQLFETYRLSKMLRSTLQKLMDKQKPDGSFAWFDGMRGDRYITQYIVTGIAKLKSLGIQDADGNLNVIVEKALPYLDKNIKSDYDYLIKTKANLEQLHIGYTQIQYLYMRSFLNQPLRNEDQKAVAYYTHQAAQYWSKFNAFSKGMIALSLFRKEKTTVPQAIIQSLRETALYKEEMGMYWGKQGYGYCWYEAPIETQALLISCFEEITHDRTIVDKMKRWLLKNKQTNNWETTKATADACYALLMSGNEWLENAPSVTIRLGEKTIESKTQKQAAGSEYFKTNFTGKEVKPSMGAISVTVDQNSSQLPTWGAVYWQYFENLDKITAAKTPLEIKKELFIERSTDHGQELLPITAKNKLQIGDKVMVRIEILVDRDLEYVHLKDMRAACFEPVNVISSYKFQGGLGYYESTKDLSTNFFFDQLPKGKYVFEYPMYVQQKGAFSNGIATLQCMYAPEFSSHSEGISVQVE